MPLARAAVAKIHAPVPFAVALPSSVAPSNTLTVLLVIASPTVPLSGENDAIVGALGTWVSTVTASAADTAPMVPAASVAVAVKLWTPLASTAVAKFHAPVPFAVAVPSSVAPSNTLTVLLASAGPARVRTVALVMPSPTVPLSGENDAIVGALGTWVSTVTASAADTALMVPAASAAVALKLCDPLVRAPVAKVHAPVPFAVAVPSTVAPS